MNILRTIRRFFVTACLASSYASSLHALPQQEIYPALLAGEDEPQYIARITLDAEKGDANAQMIIGLLLMASDGKQ
jgi:hypothetical protein